MVDGSLISSYGDQTPLATASTAKLITALVVLSKKPLAAGEQGPTITLGAADVALYQQYVAAHGSVMYVSDGAQFTEYQMLEAMMLPSANNIADSLAIWAFGSLSAYKTAATAFLQTNRFNDTHIGSDASGLASDTTSSAVDMVRIGSLVMRDPVLAEIVGKKSAVIPGIGTVQNYNRLLGVNNVVGIKTGNNDDDPGAFVGAATTQVNGVKETIISAIMGAPSLNTVLTNSGTVLAIAQNLFADTTVIPEGTILGTYQQADGTRVQAVAATNLHTMLVRGTKVQVTVDLKGITYDTPAQAVVGTATVHSTLAEQESKIPVILKQAPQVPDWRYKLTHP